MHAFTSQVTGTSLVEIRSVGPTYFGRCKLFFGKRQYLAACFFLESLEAFATHVRSDAQARFPQQREYRGLAGEADFTPATHERP